MGSQYPYGNGLSLLRSSGPRILADRHPGAALSFFGLCCRSGTFDHVMHDCQEVHQVRHGKEQIQSIAKIVAYAICVNVFFFLCEVFVVFYSRIPEHMDHFKYLFVGLHGHGVLVPWMWASMILMVVAIILLVNPVTRKNESVLIVACICVFTGTWIDKGLGMISGGFVPNPLHHVNEYVPTIPEILIAIGVCATGFLVLTALYKIAVTIKEEVAGLT